MDKTQPKHVTEICCFGICFPLLRESTSRVLDVHWIDLPQPFVFMEENIGGTKDSGQEKAV